MPAQCQPRHPHHDGLHLSRLSSMLVTLINNHLCGEMVTQATLFTSWLHTEMSAASLCPSHHIKPSVSSELCLCFVFIMFVFIQVSRPPSPCLLTLTDGDLPCFYFVVCWLAIKGFRGSFYKARRVNIDDKHPNFIFKHPFITVSVNRFSNVQVQALSTRRGFL